MTVIKNSYIKDVESYFLNLKGKGIMLSSKDYNLIENWCNRSIPKKILLDAINTIYNQLDHDISPTISQLEDKINQYIKDKYLDTKTYETDISDNNKLITKILSRIEYFKAKETKLNIVNVYSEIETELIKLKENKAKDSFNLIKDIENIYVDKLLSLLDDNLKETIKNKALEMLPTESKFYDEQTKEITLKSYIKDLVFKELDIENAFDLKNDKIQ